MATPLTVGFIGAGGIAARHLGVFQHLPDVRVIALADVDRNRAADLAAGHGAEVYTDYKELLDQAKPDAVYVTVPPFAHGEIEDELIRRKIPFFVEKPLAAQRDTVARIAEAVARAGLITGVGYQWRYFDTIAGVKNSLVHNAPRMALGFWTDSTPPPAWWRKRDQSGGQMIEQTTHLFDLARYLLGEVRQVYGAASFTPRERFPDSDVDDVSLASLHFKSGAIANIASTCILNSGHRVGLDIYCEGVVYECNQDVVWVDHGHGNREEWRPQIDPVWEEDNTFLNAVRDNNPALVRSDYADAFRTHQLLDLCLQSAQQGRALDVE